MVSLVMCDTYSKRTDAYRQGLASPLVLATPLALRTLARHLARRNKRF